MNTERAHRHIVHVTTAHPATDNRIFEKECAAARNAGFRVSLVARSGRSRAVSGIVLRAIPQRSGRLARMLLGPLDAWRQLSAAAPDVVHLHDPELIPLGVLWRLIKRTPVVFDAHEDLPAQVLTKPYLPRWLRKPVAGLARLLEKIANASFDGIVVAVPEFAMTFPRPEVAVVQNYPWLQNYTAPTEPPSNTRICFVGGITKQRGIHEMVSAVQRTQSGAELAVAGPIQQAPLRRLLGESPGVNYAGVIPPREIPDFISECVAGLLLYHPAPNHVRSKPTKLFEYMAAGRPFIASDFPYWRDLVGDSGGLFVDPLDASAVALAIDRVLSDPELARTMGRAGRKVLERQFTFERESTQLIALYDQLLALDTSSLDHGVDAHPEGQQ